MCDGVKYSNNDNNFIDIDLINQQLYLQHSEEHSYHNYNIFISLWFYSLVDDNTYNYKIIKLYNYMAKLKLLIEKNIFNKLNKEHD